MQSRRYSSLLARPDATSNSKIAGTSIAAVANPYAMTVIRNTPSVYCMTKLVIAQNVPIGQISDAKAIAGDGLRPPRATYRPKLAAANDGQEWLELCLKRPAEGHHQPHARGYADEEKKYRAQADADIYTARAFVV